MVRRRTLLKTLPIGFASGVVGTMSGPTIAFAHKQRLSLTQVEWNKRSETLDVTHSFHIHEAENTLYEAGLIRYPDLTKLKSRAILALYIDTRFTLAVDGSKKLPLEIIGAEIDGQSVYVYQQVPLETVPKRLIVSVAIFREFTKEQINNVDVNLNGQIQSLQFRGDDGPKSVTV